MAKSGTITANGTTKADAGGAGVFNTLYVWGTFGGGTLKISVGPDASNRFPLTDAPIGGEEVEITEPGFLNMEVKTAGFDLILSGATGPSIEWRIL